MDAAQGFLAHKPFEGFDAQSEFAESQGPFGGKATSAQPLEIFHRRIFRSIDNPEVFAATNPKKGLPSV